MRKFALAFALLALAPILNAAPASAQTGSNPQTYISGLGTDSGTCGRAAPCLTLTYTLTQTQASGDVTVVDSWISPNENVVITGDVSIHGTGVFAEFGPQSGDALTINAGASDTVQLDHLQIHNFGTATNGIVFNSGHKLRLRDNSGISGFNPSGVSLLFSPGGTGSQDSLLSIEGDSHIGGGGVGNVLVRPVGSGSRGAQVEIRDSVILDSNTGYGFKIDTTGGPTAGSEAVISNSSIHDVGTNAITVLAPSVPGHVVVYQTNIDHAENFGVYANGAMAQVLLDNSTINHSMGTGVEVNASGIIGSFGNNSINFTNNNNTGVLTPQSLH